MSKPEIPKGVPMSFESGNFHGSEQHRGHDHGSFIVSIMIASRLQIL
jgi:hypothetical protein